MKKISLVKICKAYFSRKIKKMKPQTTEKGIICVGGVER